MIDIPVLLGLASGAGFSTFQLVQLVHMYRTKSATGLSLWSVAGQLACTAGYAAYGVAIGSIPLIVCDCVSILILGGQGVLKVMYEGVRA